MAIKISQESFSSPMGGFENLVGETVVEVKDGPEMKGENVVTTTIVTQSGRAFVIFPWPSCGWDIAYCMPQDEVGEEKVILVMDRQAAKATEEMAGQLRAAHDGRYEVFVSHEIEAGLEVLEKALEDKS